MKVRSPEPGVRSSQSLRFLIGLLGCGFLLARLILFYSGPLDPACEDLTFW